MTKTKSYPLDDSPLHLLHRAGQYADTLFQTEMSALDVTPRQYAVLRALAKDPGASQTDLVAATGIDRSTIADLTRRIERKGLVRRRRTRVDARTYTIMLTNEGQKLLDAASPAASRASSRLLAAMVDKQAQTFVEHLSIIVEAFAREDRSSSDDATEKAN
jgi:DNA-binding MarR family transcriptional regulator